MAGVFAGDEVGVAEGFDGPEGDVTQVADGSWDEGEHESEKPVGEGGFEWLEEGLKSFGETGDDVFGGALDGVGEGVVSGGLEVVVDEEAGVSFGGSLLEYFVGVLVVDEFVFERDVEFEFLGSEDIVC